jgi:phosphate transport system permease protein
MSSSLLFLILAALTAVGYLGGRWRAASAAQGDARRLHSRTTYHGLAVGMGAFLAGAATYVLLSFAATFMPSLAGSPVVSFAPVVLALAVFVVVYLRITPEFRARNLVELMVLGLLISASLIAIFTTVAIVLSLVFETARFFSQYSWTEFFFGVVWSPAFQGNSQLGMLPLLWGTLYVSFIALLVAVPIGLFTAIYLTQYATTRLRRIIKPVIEVLAGIPTIVYGLFALITVGPFLRDYFAQPTGLGSSSASVMTAGVVMGIMLIPFVSSLSDDIINAVPRAMRDGSLALGSTPSETIRRVIIPAALPGIVGAILLAASRAVGETMIVVLGAGAAARMSLNPFEAMTTVTVKIVSQLTGDTDFSSPETLVAFALGITLFTLTLCMNVVALYIVRRYREQYE